MRIEKCPECENEHITGTYYMNCIDCGWVQDKDPQTEAAIAQDWLDIERERDYIRRESGFYDVDDYV